MADIEEKDIVEPDETRKKIEGSVDPLKDNPWKEFRISGVTEMRKYVIGENPEGIAFQSQPNEEGMVARDPGDHTKQWYIPKELFDKYYEPAPEKEAK